MKSFVFLITFLVLTNTIIADDSLRVASVSPLSRSIIAGPEAVITIEFNLPVEPSLFIDTTFMVWGRWSGVHKGLLEFSPDSTALTFNPDNTFFYGEMVTVSLSKGIKSVNGKTLPKGFTWNFWIITTSGTLELTRTETINVRREGEGWIQTYGTYAGDLDGDGWSDFLVPNERPNDVRVFMNDGGGHYNDFTIFQITGGSRPSTNEGMDYNLD